MTELDNKLLDNGIEELQKEVKELEDNTLVAIEELEKKLGSVEIIADIPRDWETDHNVIDIFTMEKQVPLAESIRQIIM